jgi:hypothetical protein
VSKPASLRRRLGLAGLAAPLLLAGGLTGCAAQYSAATAASYVPGQGNFTDSAAVKVRAIVVVSDTDGQGALTAVLINDGSKPDSLTGVGVDGGSATLSPSSIKLPPRTMVKVGIPSTAPAGQGGTTGKPPTVFVTGEKVVPGGTVDLTFSFANSPSATATSVILANTGEYADIPLPTGS